MKAVIGVVPQDIAVYPDMSARENLHVLGTHVRAEPGRSSSKRVDEVLELISLVDRQNDRVDKFSGGMKRRVNIGVALLHRPRVLYLDEPTVGIDPQSRRSILDGILALRDQGMTLLYTTHYMAEAQELSDRIGIIDHGQHDRHGHARGAREDRRRGVARRGGRRPRPRRDDRALVGGAAACRRRSVEEDGHAELLVADANAVLPRLFEAAAAAGSRITTVNVREPNLELVFLHLTGRSACGRAERARS